MSPDHEPARGPQPPSIPWISTETEMETHARECRARIVKVKIRNGVYRIASAIYSTVSVQDATATTREHLYRISLHWLSEFDIRDGKTTQRFGERASPNRPTNALEFRVLETTRPDGRRVTVARLGPKGQISADPKGVGVMSFLRGTLVAWVVERHPDASVVPGSLSHVDARTEEEKALRDNFFTRSGFAVQATPDGGGKFFAPSIQDLRTTWNGEKVVEIASSVIADALCAQVEVSILEKRIATHEAEIDAMRKEKRSAEVRSRIWIAITVVSLVFAIVFGIQPRVS